MRFGSLFAGVGGFDIGLENAGWQCAWQVEWDSHCQQTLGHHWPNVPKWGDVSDVNGAELPPVDVITFGSPCQDLSVAGKRAGLIEGGRSNLFFQATRIIREMKEKTNGQYPRIAIWENVPGALSSNNGDDFEAVLGEMADLGSYHLEWSVLDAQFFGVPQRRRRVFVIAVLDPAIAERSGGQILVVGQSRRRNTKKSKPQRKNPAADVAGCLRSGGDGGVPSSRGEHLIVESLYPDVAGTLGGGSGDRGWSSDTDRMTFIPVVNPALIIDGTRIDDVRIYDDEITPTLTNRMGTGGNNVPFVAQEPFVKSRRAQSPEDHETWVEGGPAPTLNAFDNGTESRATVVVPTVGFSHTQGLDPQVSETAFPTLRTEGGGHAVAIPIQGTIIGRSDTAGPQGPGFGQEGDPMYTVDTISMHGVAVAYDEYNDTLGGDIHHSLRAGTRQSTGVVSPMSVRRLTPIECERLMGWPDNHTLHRADGKTNSDTTRYKMCGNGVASPVAQWIAESINSIL